MKKLNIIQIKQEKIGELKGNYAKALTSPEMGYEIFKEYLEDADREYFVVAILNTKNVINAIHTVSTGSLNSAIVHPREVFKLAILHNGASIIVAHNHPSGDPSPSREDLEVTKRLVEAGQIIGIEVLDHIIVGDNRFCSLKEKNYM